MKQINCYLVVILCLSFYSFEVKAADACKNIEACHSSRPAAAETQKILIRLDEIMQMDKSGLKPGEKKKLKDELHGMRSKLKQIGGGIYLSAGAVIVILLLLIFLA